MKKFLILCSIISLFFLTNVSNSTPNQTLNSFKAEVVRVVDGDTVRVNKDGKELKVRMLNIDTPEIKYQGETQGYWANRASEELKEILPVGKKVIIYVAREGRDIYGRVLGTIVAGSTNFNRFMIKEGLAVPYIIYPNIDDAETISHLAREAKKYNRGQYISFINPPYVWRRQVSGRELKYFTGDIKTKCYVTPDKYKTIDLTDRVFFKMEEDAIQANYIKCRSRKIR